MDNTVFVTDNNGVSSKDHTRLKNLNITIMKATKITVQSFANASVEKVWEAWTDPKHITKWNYADDSWHCPSAQNDLRVGGRYFARMEAKDGSYGFDFEATYDEIVLHKRITYTMTDGRKATTVFDSLGNKTKVVTSFDAESENSEELQRDGWQAILNNFIQYVNK